MKKRLIAMVLTLSMVLLMSSAAAYADSFSSIDGSEQWETHVDESTDSSFDASELSHLSGVELFWEFIVTLDDETMQGVLMDDALVYSMQQYEYWFPEEPSPLQPMSAVSLPLNAYKDGTYFTVNEKACDDHHGSCYVGTSNSACMLSSTTTGNCKKHHTGIQCMGFAYYVYEQYNGVQCSSANQLSKAFSVTSTDDAILYYAHLPIGSHIRVGANQHSIIIGAISPTGISVYEANTDGHCKVTYTTKTWSQIANQWPKISYAYAPSHTHTMLSNIAWVKVPGANTCLQRSGVCIYCDATVTEHDRYHNIVSGKCTKCGYYV